MELFQSGNLSLARVTRESLRGCLILIIAHNLTKMIQIIWVE